MQLGCPCYATYPHMTTDPPPALKMRFAAERADKLLAPTVHRT